jgi:pimeloyl-ACP methyl ester carboxylesterase
VLCVPGIWDNARAFDALRARLIARGLGETAAVDLRPNDGSATISNLVEQLEAATQSLLARSGASAVDLVGFSMGALVSQAFLSQRRHRVRRFISISGPHAGSWLAYLGRRPGAKDMRPGSALLASLGRDAKALGVDQVHCFRTPFDLMVFPSRSARLSGAIERTFPVLLHPLMLRDARVLDAVADALLAP